MGYTNWTEKVNLRVARSPVGRYFRLEHSGHVRLILLVDIEGIY